jgi:ABC-type nitrate/sulfonate/bicarbonate transport system substrate-binding protein
MQSSNARGRNSRVLAGLLLWLLQATTVSAAELTPLKVGISEPVNTVLAIWMADAAGLYAAHGLKVEIINMSGGSRGAAELAAGRIDAMHVGLSSVVRLNRNGSDLRIVAALANVIRFTFFSAPGITNAAGLKGGAVGVSTFGSESDATVTLALQRLGLNRDDVTLKELGGGSRRLAAVKSGEIQATAVNEPTASIAREQGVNVLVDLVPERIPWLFTGIAVRRETIENRRDVLMRFLRATAEGNYLAISDSARARDVLARQTNTNDAKILDISYNDFTQLSPPTIEPTNAAAANILAQFPAGGSTNVADYVDTRILDELKRQRFFETLEQKYGKR